MKIRYLAIHPAQYNGTLNDGWKYVSKKKQTALMSESKMKKLVKQHGGDVQIAIGPLTIANVATLAFYDAGTNEDLLFIVDSVEKSIVPDEVGKIHTGLSYIKTCDYSGKLVKAYNLLVQLDDEMADGDIALCR